MEQNKRFEVFGTLTKMETVFTIDQKILAGTLVFEALKPFPDYYFDSPMGAKPVYLYLALNEQYTLEDILRASQKVQLEFDATFDAGKGFLQVFDAKYNILRIRHLKDYNLLEKLQLKFTENGIHFLQKTKKYKDELVKIKIIKFFKLKEIADNIFLDKREKNFAYLEIPNHLSWDEFENLNNKVKYNWIESKFDAAVGAFYYNGRLHEMIRIYSNKIGPEYLQKLQKLFLDKMK
jgi:cell division protein FtsI/penicillin-binding protein 2